MSNNIKLMIWGAVIGLAGLVLLILSNTNVLVPLGVFIMMWGNNMQLRQEILTQAHLDRLKELEKLMVECPK